MLHDDMRHGGCVREGCPLQFSAPESLEALLAQDSADSARLVFLQTLLEWDHRDSKKKTKQVSLLDVGKLRDVEKAECDHICMLHHHIHTRIQGAIRSSEQKQTESKGCYSAELAILKQVSHCQCPIHDLLPHGPLFPPPTTLSSEEPAVSTTGSQAMDCDFISGDDARRYAFLEVAHLNRGLKVKGLNGRQKIVERSQVYLKELGSSPPLAQLLCRMCHKLWTTCEGYHVGEARDPERCGGPAVRLQFQALLRLYPAFVQWFDVLTLEAGVEWKQIAQADSTARREATTRMWKNGNRARSSKHEIRDVIQLETEYESSDCASLEAESSFGDESDMDDETPESEPSLKRRCL